MSDSELEWVVSACNLTRGGHAYRLAKNKGDICDCNLI